MIKFSHFHRNFMLRRWEHIRERISYSDKDFSSIENTIYHYLPEDQTDEGPNASDFILQNIEGNIFIEHITNHNTDLQGNTRNARFRENTFIRDYHKQNRSIRRNRNTETVLRSKRNLLIYNYAPLQHVLHYRPTYMTSYHKWHNLFDTFINNLLLSLKQNDKTHLVKIQLPDHIPSLTSLNKAARKINQETVKNFKEFKSFTLLDIWKLLGDDPDTSLLSKIPEEYWARVIIVFHDDRWSSMSLGMLRGISEETEQEGNERDAKTARKYILRLLIDLQNVSTDGITEEEELEIEEEKESDNSVDKSTDDSDKVVISDIDDEEKPVKPRKVKVIEKTEEELDAELDAIEKKKEQQLEMDDIKSVEDIIHKKAKEPEKNFKEIADDLADKGRLSAPEYRRALKLIEKQNSLVVPMNGQKLVDFVNITEEDIKIPETTIPQEMDGVFTQGLLNNRSDLVKKNYIKDIMPRDTVRHVTNLQNSGVALTNVEHKKVQDAIGGYEVYSFKLSPITGVPSTVSMKLPIIEEDGTFMVNGNKYYLRWQRGDLPIRKTKPHEVALTSYYGKVFITRSDKVTDNYSQWLIKQITSQSTNTEQNVIKDIKLSNVFVFDVDVPRIYSILSQGFKSFTVDGLSLHFDYKRRDQFFTPEEIKKYEKYGKYLIGKGKGGIVVVDKLNNFYLNKDGKETFLGSIEELTKGILGTPPIDVAEINVLGKGIPVGFVLGYLEGFKTLIKILNVDPRIVPSGESLKLESDEFAVRFADESYIFSRDDQYASLFFSGFNRYKRLIQHYTSREFNKKDVYKTVLENSGLSSRYLREVELMYELFIDPITLDILKQRGEPEEFEGLLYHSVELLMTDWHPHETDLNYQRLKGHERLTGIFYNELVKSVRQYKNNPIKSKAKIELNPEKVYMDICAEGSMSKQNNPIHNVREKDDVTFTGFGGRSADSMTVKSRSYYKNDLGTISEHAPDSGKVGVSSYLSYNPTFNSLRGTTDRVDPDKVNAAELFSVGAVTKASGDRDDPKRLNFSSIQDGSTISSIGYKTSPIRTGAEKTLAHRNDSMFASTALDDGTVKEITDKYLTVKYKNGEEKTYELGIKYGVDADATIPHNLVANVKKGQKVKRGDVIAYNDDFYVVEPLDPTQVVHKAGILSTVALWETSGTFEDSCEISHSLAEKLQSKTAKKRQILVDFSQGIKDIVKIGDKVDLETALCILEESVTAGTNTLDDASIELLKSLSKNAPKAKFSGIVDKIEVFYNGEVSDMSEDLQKITKASDRRIKAVENVKGSQVTNGRVGNNMRVDNQPLGKNKAVINIYILGEEPMGVADKIAVAHQLKSIVRHVHQTPLHTVDGENIDIMFGARSLDNRIVNSAMIFGTTTSILEAGTKKALKAYFGE